MKQYWHDRQKKADANVVRKLELIIRTMDLSKLSLDMERDDVTAIYAMAAKVAEIRSKYDRY